jgi:Ca2+-binding RTX toxin-like protein
VWGPGDGSDIVEGNSGTDTMQFGGSNISEEISLSANGSHALLTRNIAGVTMDLHGMETVNIAALGGTDNVTIGDLTGTGIKQIHVDLGAFDGGDDGAIDTVSVGFTAGNDAIDFNVKPGPAVVNSLGGAQVFVDHQSVGDRFLIDGGAGNDSVTANGTGGDDVIGIARDSTNSVAVFAQDGQPVSVTGVEQLLVKGGAGNDTISAQNGIASQVTQLTIDGGAGNDKITGGDGADLLLGGDGNDVIRGGIGSDTAQLGAGDDTFVWGPGDGSDIVEGNSGNDTMQFSGSNISEDISLSANGSHALLTRNIAGVAMDLHGMENVNIAALGGTDNIAIGDLRGTGIKQVHVDLGAFDGTGDEQVDNVTINGTAGNDSIKLSTRADGALVVGGLSEEVVIEHFDLNDVVHIAGLGGHDIIDTSALGAGHPKISFDGVDLPLAAAATEAQDGGPSDPFQNIAAGGP